MQLKLCSPYDVTPDLVEKLVKKLTAKSNDVFEMYAQLCLYEKQVTLLVEDRQLDERLLLHFQRQVKPVLDKIDEIKSISELFTNDSFSDVLYPLYEFWCNEKCDPKGDYFEIAKI